MTGRLMTKCFRTGLMLLVTLAVTSPLRAADEKKKPPKVTYEDDVKPLLQQKCFSCHNPDKKSGDLDLTNYTSVMQGGGSGEVIEAGDSGSSYLYQLITHESEPFMPPKSPKMDDKIIETIRKWIDGGVLENKGSKARGAKKKKFDLALQAPSTARPKTPPMPPRLPLQPYVATNKATAAAAVATNPWSPIAAIAGQKQVLLYNTKTLKLVGALPFPEGFPQVLRFSRNGSLLLAGGGRGGASGRVVVWEVKTGERVMEVGKEFDTVLAADISSDHSLIALGGPQRVVRIYSTETGQLLHELRKHTDWIYSVEFSPDSVLLASGDRNGGLFVWEAYTGREYLTLKAHSKRVCSVSWRSDSNVLASCSEDGSVRLWEMENGRSIKNWGAHGGGVADIEFARDGRLVTCGRDRITRLWDQNGKALRTFEAFGDLALCATICDETNRVIAGDWTGSIRVWNAADGKRVGEVAMNPPRLEARLQTATTQLTSYQNQLKPLAQAAKAAQDAAAKIRADLAAAQKRVQQETARLKAAQANATKYKADLAKRNAEYTATVKNRDALKGAAPLLATAAKQAAEAVKKLPGDKAAAEIAAKLQTLSNQRNQQAQAAEKTVAAQAAAVTQMKQALDNAAKTITAATKALAAANADVKRLTPLLKPATDKAAATEKAAAAASEKVKLAEQDVQRWRDELAFVKRLEELAQQRKQAAAALDEAAEREAEATDAVKAITQQLTKAEGEVASTQKAVATAQGQQTAAATALKTALARLAQHEAAKKQSEQQASNLAAVVADLKAAATHVAQAAQRVKDDKSVQQATLTLQNLLKANAARRTAAAQQAAKLTKELTQVKAAVTTAESAVAKAKADIAAKRQMLASKKAAVAPLAKQLAEAKKKLAEQAAQVANAQKKLEAAVQEIAGAKGLTAGNS